MRRRFLAAVLAGLLACASGAGAGVRLPGGFVADTLVTGLDEPTGMAILPDGRVLITEQRTGNVRLYVDGHIAATDPVMVVPDLTVNHYERGLQSVAVDPGWPARPYVYLYYTRSGGFCRLARYRASGDIADPLGESLALGDSLVLLDDIPDDNGAHNGGGLRFGPGDHLFVSVGDDMDPCEASDSTSLRGALLRLDVSRLPEGPGGPVPRDLITPAMNPLTASDSVARLVWAYGMRNPWRFSVDQPTGAVYLADVGSNDYEELNEVFPGDYLGWPYREGPMVHIRESCPERGGTGANAFKGPVVAWAHVGTSQRAITTAGMYRPVPGAPSNWPQNYGGFYGDLFYGDYFEGCLRRLKRLSGSWGTPPPAYGQPSPENWAEGLNAAVDFHVGPDGSLWWLSQFDSTWGSATGTLQRIRWVGLDPNVAVGEDGSASRPALGAFPNPFRGETQIAFRLPVEEPVALAVYDLAGRRVRRLLEGAAPAGENAIAWDGRDDKGRPAGPGLYFVRLRRAREGALDARVLRLR